MKRKIKFGTRFTDKSYSLSYSLVFIWLFKSSIYSSKDCISEYLLILSSVGSNILITLFK